MDIADAVLGRIAARSPIFDAVAIEEHFHYTERGHLDLAASDETWLRRLVQGADTSELVLNLSRRDTNDVEPIASYDERSGCWWTGRYVGEVQYEGRTLRILPRFGMPHLLRWLSCIWGIRLLSTKGKYEKTQIWLWALLARIWENQLLVASKHGLPTSRVDQLYRGQTIRGRLEVRLLHRK